MYICIHIHTYVYIHIYVCIHTHTHKKKEWDQMSKVNESEHIKLIAQRDKDVEETAMKFICQEIRYSTRNSPIKTKPHISLRS